MTSRNSNGRWAVLLPVFAAVALTCYWLAGPIRDGGDPSFLVVYCAHDKVYSEAVLKDFEKRTGIRVDVRYDTEATKSLGLVNLIVAERNQPRCDVFWNNELLGTVELQQQGLLEPHKGNGWTRLPEKYRDDDGHWVGFGARLRVHIINAHELDVRSETVQQLFELEPGNAAIAKPLFGTTLTHYTVLWDQWGPGALKAWHHDLRLRGIRELDGNGAVKDVVANGTCAAGLTDTDDFFVAKDDGKPVEMLPVLVQRLTPLEFVKRVIDKPLDSDSAPPKEPTAAGLPLSEPAPDSKVNQAESSARSAQSNQRLPEARTICIPNTAAIIKGTKRQEAARKLVDFLASADVEIALSRSKSRQVPLGPVDESLLSDEVRQLKGFAENGIDLRPLLHARRECLEWLKSEYLR